MTTIKLNIGCGWKKKPAPWINVDNGAYCEPDECWDVQHTWPHKTETVDAIEACHVLEHCRKLPHIMGEAYRVLIPGGTFKIEVPHPRHDFYLGDPTHVQPIIRPTLELFDGELCRQWERDKVSNTPLAFIHGVNFRIISDEMHLNPTWKDRMIRDGIITDTLAIVKEEQFRFIIDSYYNVISEMVFVLERR